MPLQPIAPAHIGHGSALLYSVHGTRNSRDQPLDASDTTASSAWAVASPMVARAFTPSRRTAPSGPTSTAPYG